MPLFRRRGPGRRSPTAAPDDLADGTLLCDDPHARVHRFEDEPSDDDRICRCRLIARPNGIWVALLEFRRRLPGGVYLLYVCVAAGLFGIWMMRKLMFGAWEDTEVDSMIAAERVGGLDDAEVIEHEVHPERFEETTPAATR